MPTLKYPLEYDGDGSFVTLEDDSDLIFAQLLSICAQTEPETFPYTPTFGVLDPSFNSVSRGDFIIQASRFIPEIVVTSISGDFDSETGRLGLEVSYRRP